MIVPKNKTFIARHNQADGNLPVIRSVRRIQRAATLVEAHLAAQRALQLVFQLKSLRERINGFCV
jgi:hypothetical protein